MTGMRARRVAKSLALSATVLAMVVVVVLGAWLTRPLPADLREMGTTGLRIEDRHGLLLRSTRAADGSRARWTPLTQMDPDLLLAFVAVEDKRFWSHHGIDIAAVGRAAVANQRAGRIVSGASTIPMQLARLLHPGARGWRSKLSESVWALRLDWQLSKSELLEQYLNLGQGAVGVTTAAALYFGTAASELSVGEAAMLAGLAHAPSRDNPLVAPRAARARRAIALARMQRAGMISTAEQRRASLEPVHTRGHATPFLAPHFTTRLVQLDARTSQGASQEDRVWRATLDAALQEEVEGEVRHAVDQLRARHVRHGAAVVIDNVSGDVLAWVGSPDFWNADGGQTDMVVSPRQPGSALKPFLYALAFDRDVTAGTVLPDVPRAYATTTGSYSPRNYDRRFRGPVRAREALASSYNVPAVELAQRVGVGDLLSVLRRAGLSTLTRDADHYGLGLALGNGDVTLLELANAYRALANDGVWSPWRVLESGRGTPERDVTRAPSETRVVSSRAAALVLDVLADPIARVPGFGLQTPFDFPFRTAVKTGTSRHFTDNWAVATTRGFTVAVWVGNFSGQPMQGVSGVTGAGPLLSRVVTLTAARYAPGALRSPAEVGLVAAEICRVSGLRPTRACPGMTEWFVEGTQPLRDDDWVVEYRVKLPAEYAEWEAVDGGRYELADLMEDEGAELAASVSVPVAKGFRIVSPADGDVLRVPPGVPTEYATVALRAMGESGEVRWFVNEVPHAGGRWSLVRGDHTIRAIAASGSVSDIRVRVD